MYHRLLILISLMLMLSVSADAQEPAPPETPDTALIEAAIDSDWDAVREMILAGADPNAYSEAVLFLSATTVLGEALEDRNFEMAAWLLEHGADPYLAPAGGQPAMFPFAGLNDMEMLTFLVEHGVDPVRSVEITHPLLGMLEMNTALSDNRDEFNEALETPRYEFTPLMAAADSGALEAVDYLAGLGGWYERPGCFIDCVVRGDAEGVRRHLADNTASLEFPHGVGMWKPLHFAAALNRGEVIDALTKGGAQIDGGNLGGHTPLMEAAIRGRLDAVERLIGLGADVNHANDDGYNPLHMMGLMGDVFADNGSLPWPPFHGHPDTAQALIDAGTEIEARTDLDLTPLFYATGYQNYTGLAEVLIANGADIEAETEKGVRPLQRSCGVDSFESIALLIEHGADVNARDKQGLTPLIKAASRGREQTIRLLLDHGADPRAISDWGSSVLINLASNPNGPYPELLDEVLATGMHVETRDSHGRTPLHHAAKRGSVGGIQYLLSHGANPGALDRDSQTPLHSAANWGQVDCIRVLLDGGADANARDLRKQTPLHIACSKHHPDAVEALLEAGADTQAQDWEGSLPIDFLPDIDPEFTYMNEDIRAIRALLGAKEEGGPETSLD